MAHTHTSSKLKDNLGEFLQGLAELGEWATSGKAWMEIAQYQDWKRRQLMKEKREHLYELKRRKWIETKTIGNRLVGRLTDQGWKRALRDKIRGETKKCAHGVCIITFDVPETERHIRKVLRLFLKECGFTKLQHSVWMTEKNVIEPLMLLLQRKNLHQWIKIIHGNIINPRPFDVFRAHRTKQ